MKDLLYKEFKLSINSAFFLMVLFAALIMIPGWIYSIAMMYTLFIAMPNIFMASRSQNDISFSVMLPVKKSEVVKARVLSVMIMQVLPVLLGTVFAAVNIIVYKGNTFFMNPNVAFFGLVFVMYALFNLVFFPGFYKTAYKVGGPAVWANVVAVVFMAVVELVNIVIPSIGAYIGGINNMAAQLPVLFAGIVIYLAGTWLAYRISAKRFERVDI